MRDLLALILLVVLMVLPLTGRGASAAADRVVVAASFYPMDEFAQQVGADRSRVRHPTPAGADAPDYEFTPSDISAVSTCKARIYHRSGLEPGAPELLPP